MAQCLTIKYRNNFTFYILLLRKNGEKCKAIKFWVELMKSALRYTFVYRQKLAELLSQIGELRMSVISTSSMA
jgi:hypothetical protein